MTLDEIAARADAATQGPWVIHDLSDHIYSPSDDTGWWWVWQESKLPYYGGVFDPNERTDRGVADGSIGKCAIDDNQTGVQEKLDAEFIAHAREDVPALLAALRAVEAVVSERYKLWAAICGETCGKEVYGIDHDAIADSIAAAIETAIREALGS